MRRFPVLLALALGSAFAGEVAAQQPAAPPSDPVPPNTPEATAPPPDAPPSPEPPDPAPAATPELLAPPIQPVATRSEAPPPPYVPPEEEARSRYPDYVVGGVVSLVAAVGLGVGCAVAAVTSNPKTALGLGALATTSAGVGVPLAMLGAADDEAEDEHLVGAGIVVATPGVIAVGLGGTIWAYREAGDGDHTLTTPLVLVAGGAAALVAGVITYSFGASHREAKGPTATLGVGPGSVGMSGSF